MSDKNEGRTRSIDVARLAGVSRSAVSRTFTPGAYVSDATREKVLRASKTLDYHPNAMARSIKTKRSGIIGVISSDLQNPFYADTLEKIGSALQENGLGSLVLFGDETSTSRQISQILSYQVDALIVTNAVLSSTLTDSISRMKLPVVAVNRYFPQDWVTSITCDNVAGAAAMADHLLDIGCSKIALISGKSEASSSRYREAGFIRALVKRGTAPIAIESGDYSHDSGVIAARKLLSAAIVPDAIFCANDLMAIGTIDIARTEFGLRIPVDLRVAGFDNSIIGSWQSYNLTSVDQNVTQMIDLAVKSVIRQLRGGADRGGQHLQVQGKLIIRQSTGAIASPIDNAFAKCK
ncbi:MAG: LacI family transcriptional regulator [Mesorhizobium sp.]|uniref:LacI family DNA-binding transcriptional regulator n=1 Tax=Mesorhizobium sp. TaxID=1871066 RepID=UPI000FE558A0|nr:LacI family DNA-binding transcriptional regulator [Mesorhizobium sp.]RWF85515.1 MAG: LacI family transcriptional regulator [Mesorhizobium sp.]TJW50038.1 MAG: LacI family transcriptional regulator [Mesorhizobium sp.]